MIDAEQPASSITVTRQTVGTKDGEQDFILCQHYVGIRRFRVSAPDAKTAVEWMGCDGKPGDTKYPGDDESDETIDVLGHEVYARHGDPDDPPVYSDLVENAMAEGGLPMLPEATPSEPSNPASIWTSNWTPVGGMTMTGTIDAPEVQDGGRALIAELVCGSDADMFVRIHSWNDEGDHHALAAILALAKGRRVKVTFEIGDEVAGA